MPTVMSLERPRMPSFLGLGDNAVGNWILSQPAPIAIGLSILGAMASGAVIGGAVIWAKNKVTGR